MYSPKEAQFSERERQVMLDSVDRRLGAPVEHKPSAVAALGAMPATAVDQIHVAEQLLGKRDSDPTRDEILAELDWVIERACEHLGGDRAGRYLRKFYPWYVERLGGDRVLQAGTPEEAHDLLAQQLVHVVLAGARLRDAHDPADRSGWDLCRDLDPNTA